MSWYKVEEFSPDKVAVCCWVVSVNPAFVTVNTRKVERAVLPAGKVESMLALRSGMSTIIAIPKELAKEKGLDECILREYP